ncbi:MAG: exodeoxyribonuclease VII large subunit, partial [Desulfatitalea sp.]|nr:exodeoxyribonuclease VII large subunit [Desulfatitalea sp.]
IALGRITVYEPRGNYQIVLEYAEPKGAGALQLAFEQLKEKLSREGLFDAARKAPLPFMPSTIAVITSATGAVIRDILHVLRRRFPNVRVELLPVRVQGDAAPDEIVGALRIANMRAKADVIILARGGGSLEDLAPFNSEEVARAIFASQIPVVSAVGHETDFTIADFVADVRAPTPSAAAELIVPVKAELQQRCMLLHQRCTRAVARITDRRRERLEAVRRSLVHPIRKVQENRLWLDDWTDRLMRAVRTTVQDRRTVIERRSHRLLRCTPLGDARDQKQTVALLKFKMSQAMVRQLNENKNRLAMGHTSLEALSPRAVLQRGYSITRRMDNQHIVMETNNVETGEHLEIVLAHGRLDVTVDRVKE